MPYDPLMTLRPLAKMLNEQPRRKRTTHIEVMEAGDGTIRLTPITDPIIRRILGWKETDQVLRYTPF
jgi:hypothetical protein